MALIEYIHDTSLPELPIIAIIRSNPRLGIIRFMNNSYLKKIALSINNLHHYSEIATNMYNQLGNCLNIRA